jgi:tRNA pseudouridine55 synthase
MPSGILLLDKPRGVSSNAALQRVRSLFGRVKAGHVGSLDPLATGMLPICLGEATKIAGDILAGRKRYRFSVALGAATATGDSEGDVTQTLPVPQLASAQVQGVLQRFLGAQTQVPPMYSALKRDGQPLYKLARAGVEVAREARAIELFELTLLALGPASLELEALCSKGTYIRVLAADLAAALGTCGHVTSLRRLYVEPFANEPMHPLESLRAALPELLPVDWPLQHLPALQLGVGETRRLLQGQALMVAVEAAPRVRLYDAGGHFLGFGAVDGHGALQPRRLLQPAG